MPPLLIVVASTCALLLLALLWLILHGQLDYVIGRTSLRVTLFGFTVRRIPFADIRRVGTPKRDGSWLTTESWCNSFDQSHRGLVVHRLSGFRRRFLITPAQRYTFRSELRQAVAKVQGPEAAAAADPDDAE